MRGVKNPVRHPEWDTPEWRRTKRAVFYRDHYRCIRCHKRFSSTYLTAHHLQTREEGWRFEEDNIVSLCFDCHNIVEIYRLKTRADIIGSFPVPPPELQDWIEMKEKSDDPIQFDDSIPVYGIAYLDYHHCLKCGYSGNYPKKWIEYKQNGVTVRGFCYLCQTCAAEVVKKGLSTIAEIVGDSEMRKIFSETSHRYEVFNRAFYEAFRQPKWIKEKFVGKPDSGGSRKGLAP